MKKSTRVLAAALCGILLLPAAGCGEKETTGGDENLDLSVHLHIYDYCVFDDDWAIFKEAEEKTGVALHGTAVETISSSAQAFSTMLADRTLPDIIAYTGDELKENGMQGALIPLEDLIEEHAPNIQKFFEECPEAKVAATATDGHIYYIPGTLAQPGLGNLPSMGFFIRQDWLDALGLETPTTVDEYYNVLKAFREQDPNGNGQQDEIPYFKRSGVLDDLYQLFGAKNSFYLNADGGISYGATEEAYKNAVKELAKWYSEGLIDKEIYTRGEQSREQLLSSNLGGSTHDWFSSTASYNDKYLGFGLNFVPMAPPADINGVVKEDIGRSILHGLGWGISKDNKNPERTMEYFDFWLSEEGTLLHSFGIEGKDYTVENGEYKFTPEVLNAEGGVPAYLRNEGAVVEFGAINRIEAELAGMNDLAKEGFNMYLDNGYVQPQMPSLGFTEEEQNVINAHLTDIQTFCKEQEQKWILGAEDVDATWDNYVATLQSMNLDQVVAAYNSAYVRYQQELN